MWRYTHLVGNVQIQLPNGKVIRSDSGVRGPVGDGEPHHSDDQGMKNEGGRNRGGPRALIRPLIEERNRVKKAPSEAVEPPLRFCDEAMNFGPRGRGISFRENPTLAHEMWRGYNTEDASATSECRVNSR